MAFNASRAWLVAFVAITIAACVPVARKPVGEVGPPEDRSQNLPVAVEEPAPEEAVEAPATGESAAGNPATESDATQAAPAETFDRDDVLWIQRRLQQMGYYDGRVDGEVGQATRAAVRDYQKDQKIEPDGRPTASLREFIWRNGG